MYLRAKKIRGKKYYYIVDYEKVKGKVKQKVLCYLGNAKKIKEMFDFYKKHSSQKEKI